MGSGGTFYTIRDDKSETTDELLSQMSDCDKKVKEAEEKRRKNEAEKESGDDAAAAFRAAHFICVGPLSKTVIPRNQYTMGGEIQAHKESCPHCQKVAREKREAEEAERDGRLKLRGVIGQLWSAKRDIEYYEGKRKEIEKRRKKGEQIDALELHKLGDLSYDAGVAESTINKERIFLHKLLYHEPNEITRRAANEEYKKFDLKELKRFVKKTLGKELLFLPEQLEREKRNWRTLYMFIACCRVSGKL